MSFLPLHLGCLKFADTSANLGVGVATISLLGDWSFRNLQLNIVFVIKNKNNSKNGLVNNKTYFSKMIVLK
ncbi:hypothetical protein DP73_18140 [Desulfosporosinus sp. HMP52]|nr:hypothetical protein DP73_18140 [Desulfosporosinus sp. HMP52]